jgi:nucleoid DNA-binding protein
MKTAKSNRAIVKEIGNMTGIPRKDINDALKAFAQVVQMELAKGGQVHWLHLGTFKTYERKARVTQAVINGQSVIRRHPNARYVRFKVSKRLKLHIIGKPV